MSCTGQLAPALLGDPMGKSPGFHWVGSRGFGLLDGRFGGADAAAMSAALEKYHSPLMRIRCAEASVMRNVTSYPVGPEPVCVTTGACARAPGAHTSTPSTTRPATALTLIGMFSC